MLFKIIIMLQFCWCPWCFSLCSKLCQHNSPTPNNRRHDLSASHCYTNLVPRPYFLIVWNHWKLLHFYWRGCMPSSPWQPPWMPLATTQLGVSTWVTKVTVNQLASSSRARYLATHSATLHLILPIRKWECGQGQSAHYTAPAQLNVLHGFYLFI